MGRVFAFTRSANSQLIGLAFVIGIAFLVGCGPEIKNDKSLAPRSVRAFETKAMERAKIWKVDAFLVEVIVNVVNTGNQIQPHIPDFLSYEFHSVSNAHQTFSISFSEDGTMNVFEGYLPLPYLDYVPIQPSDWELDSTEAWEIAQANVGNSLIGVDSGSNIYAIMRLGRENPTRKGQVSWYVSYDDSRGVGSIRLWLDAKTGTVWKKEQN